MVYIGTQRAKLMPTNYLVLRGRTSKIKTFLTLNHNHTWVLEGTKSGVPWLNPGDL